MYTHLLFTPEEAFILWRCALGLGVLSLHLFGCMYIHLAVGALSFMMLIILVLYYSALLGSTISLFAFFLLWAYVWLRVLIL